MITGKSITLRFTNTKTDEKASPSGGVFIAFDGSVTGSGSSVTLQGGDNTGAHTVSQVVPIPFFMSSGQRVSLQRLLKGLSSKTDYATITSNNDALQEMATAMYRNYCG